MKRPAMKAREDQRVMAERENFYDALVISLIGPAESRWWWVMLFRARGSSEVCIDVFGTTVGRVDLLQAEDLVWRKLAAIAAAHRPVTIFD